MLWTRLRRWLFEVRRLKLLARFGGIGNSLLMWVLLAGRNGRPNWSPSLEIENLIHTHIQDGKTRVSILYS